MRRSRDWPKFKNPAAPAMKREAEEDLGRGEAMFGMMSVFGQFERRPGWPRTSRTASRRPWRRRRAAPALRRCVLGPPR
jgi:hypothetical protein